MKKYLIILSVFFISLSGFTAPRLRIYCDRSDILYTFFGGYNDISNYGNFTYSYTGSSGSIFSYSGNYSSSGIILYSCNLHVFLYGGYYYYPVFSFPHTILSTSIFPIHSSGVSDISVHIEIQNEPVYTGVNPLVIESYSSKKCDIDISQFSGNPTSFSFTSFPYPITFNSATGKGSFIAPLTSTFLSYSGTFKAYNSNGVSDLVPFTINVNVLTPSMLYHIIAQSFWFICGLLTVLLFTLVFKL
ncbi:MAG: hypothetical protein WCP69_15540 [Bacteroidota bacterium]